MESKQAGDWLRDFARLADNGEIYRIDITVETSTKYRGPESRLEVTIKIPGAEPAGWA